jgi:hypothetical protein
LQKTNVEEVEALARFCPTASTFAGAIGSRAEERMVSIAGD